MRRWPAGQRHRHHQMRKGRKFHEPRAVRRRCKGYWWNLSAFKHGRKAGICLRCEVWRLRCEWRLVEAEAGRENEGRVVLLEERVDDIQETPEVAILVLVANRDECRGHVRRQANGVLDVETLSKQTSSTTVDIRSSAAEWTYRLSRPLTIIGATID